MPARTLENQSDMSLDSSQRFIKNKHNVTGI